MLTATKPAETVDTYIKADLSDPASISAAMEEMPGSIDALCNIAGLPPTSDRVLVLKVNFMGLRRFTELMIDKLSDNASIVNIASLAGLGWPEAGSQIKNLIALEDFDRVEELCDQNNVTQDDGRSYFFSKEALIVWTMMNRWTWRDRGNPYELHQPRPC